MRPVRRRTWPVCLKRAGLTRANGGASAKATATTKKRTTKASASTSTRRTKKPSRSSTTGRSTRTTYVTVRSGDTLGRIAARHGVRGGWKGLYRLNKAKVKNPNRIYIGQRLAIR